MAYSLEDAESLAAQSPAQTRYEVEVPEVVEEVDLRDLDQNLVVRNMEPPNFRGVGLRTQ